MKKFARILLRVAAALVALLAVCAVAGIFVVRSGWFQEKVRERIVAEIEKATGGRAEIGNFRFDWPRLTATASPLVLHGREAAGDPPLVSIGSATVGLRIVSMLERKVDLASVRLEQPRVRIVFYSDGSNNLPSPQVRPNWAGDLLDLAVRRYEIDDGVVEYDNRKIPMDLRGENLRVTLNYEARPERYRVDLASRRLRIAAAGFSPVVLDTSAAFTLERSRIEVARLTLATPQSRAELSGALDDLRSPRGNFSIRAAIAIREAVDLFHLPAARTGTANFDGKVSIAFAPALDFTVSGRASAQGVGFTRGRLKVEGAAARADLRLTPQSLALSGIEMTALGSKITGTASLDRRQQLHFAGNIAGLDVGKAAGIVTGREIPWSGTLAGGVSIDAVLGKPETKAQAELTIAPAPGGTPLDGEIDASYDQADGKLRLASSHVATPATRVDVSGTLGETMQVRAESTNLDDVLPALELADENAPKTLPVKLTNGTAAFRGTISGPMDDPRFSGRASLTNASVDGHAFDRFEGEIQASRSGIQVQRATLARGATQIAGSAAIAAVNDSFNDGTIAAQLSVQGAQLAELAKEVGLQTSVAGTANATVKLSGSVRQPLAEISVQIEKPAGFGEQLDRLRANVRYSPEQIEAASGEAYEGPDKLSFQGAYRHRTGDWKNGEIQFKLSAESLALASIDRIHSRQPTLDAKIGGTAEGAARIVNGEFTLDSIGGNAMARGVSWNRQTFGDITMTAATHAGEVAVHATGAGSDLKFDGHGSIRLTGDEPGSANVHFSRLSFAALQHLLTDRKEPPPFEGFIDGVNAAVNFALRKPADFHAELTVDTLQINPKSTETLRLGVEPRELILKNSKPVVVAISSKEARISSFELTGLDTSLDASGTVAFDAKTGSDLTVRGSVNLIALQLFNPDLAARGNATVQASIRGALNDPRVNGRMDLKNASLYLGDLPNGVDNANGSVIFDRNRATIENLRAETGGGTVDFSGFIGFGSPLVYRLQAVAQKVRVRYPQDVSTTFNATLALNGTPDASTLSGVLTLTRASFTPHADLAQILAQASRPSPASAPSSEYIRGMQFDVRVESDPGFEMQTSLTRNLDASVDLRLRGTFVRPALLGTISVNQGEVQVFGNRYTVNRGDIRFVNQVKIDPVFDLDLETRARGVTVNIAITGTMEKLNVNYSSDPPMQAREIIALLAVGRAPTSTAGLGPDQSAAGSTSLAEAGGGLISQAITAQLSSRLQRFFGASHVRIDPTLNGVDYLPQARLTIEQQVSNDVTLTYITNLNRTEEQIVQVEVNFSRRWSAVAVREANGLFGIDFQYKKTFK